MAAAVVGGALLNAGGALLSAAVNELATKLGSKVVDFFIGKEDIVKLVKDLKTMLSSADLLLIDAEAKLIKDRAVKKWVDDLKETVYELDDLVYKIDTEELRVELEGEGCICKVLNKLIPTLLTAFDREIKPEIEEIHGKLESLLKNQDLHLDHIKREELPERVIAPLVKESDVYGRDADKEDIIKLLLSDDASGNKLSVIPVVGIGGIGKTTLAQLVYDDERVQKIFDTKAWVTVGEGKIDCLKVLKKIIKDVTDSKDSHLELHDLQIKLKATLRAKKFLFVLDDIWDEDRNKWDLLKTSFESGLCGSKILVTTRKPLVASIMKTGTIHQLNPISNNDGWRLFSKHASISANSVEYSNLQAIGRKIVDKCNGLPLAIKSLGGLLSDKRDVEDWNKILNNDMWGLYESSSIGVLPALWLSYYYLPSHLKPCFAYCAIFPKKYKFEKEKIILLWMAEGLLHSTTRKRMEEVGEEYFRDLLSRSFFQLASKDESTHFMHDLMHDLAIFVSGEFSLDMDDSKFSNCASKIRHLSYKGGVFDLEKLEGLSKAKALRTLLTMPTSERDSKLSLRVEQMLESLLHTKGCLRVLSLTNGYITKLPASIGDLKYLKYLNLSNTSIEGIPDTVCNLYNLQILLLEGCKNVKRLPASIGNLVNLRHLSIPNSLEEMPVQIGKMKNLESLNRFIVAKNSETGIKLLKELQHLHGSLEICGLEGVADSKDVLVAGLRNKKFLSALYLDFGDSATPADEDSQKGREVLDALKPHANLKRLHIQKYKGNSFPDWVGDHLYSYLVKVKLVGCKNCCLLPPLGQLSSLKELFIESFDMVESISSEFYSSAGSGSTRRMPFRSLETLCFQDMSNLREWLFIEDKVEGGVFPHLKELVLEYCPQLKVSLPDYLPSLKKLRIVCCDQLLPLVPRAQNLDTAFPSLEIFVIKYCSGQDSLLHGGLPSSLKKIRIEFCTNLQALDEETFQRLTSLEKLEISNCYDVQCLPRGLPTSLSYLIIHHCDLLDRRVKRETGNDWPIIKNIPIVYLNSRRIQTTTTIR